MDKTAWFTKRLTTPVLNQTQEGKLHVFVRSTLTPGLPTQLFSTMTASFNNESKKERKSKFKKASSLKKKFSFLHICVLQNPPALQWHWHVCNESPGVRWPQPTQVTAVSRLRLQYSSFEFLCQSGVKVPAEQAYFLHFWFPFFLKFFFVQGRNHSYLVGWWQARFPFYAKDL